MRKKMGRFISRLEDEQNQGTLDIDHEITSIRRLIDMAMYDRFPLTDSRMLLDILQGLRKLKINQVVIKDGEFRPVFFKQEL
jgi:hypothetical protein